VVQLPDNDHLRANHHVVGYPDPIQTASAIDLAARPDDDITPIAHVDAAVYLVAFAELRDDEPEQKAAHGVEYPSSGKRQIR
jgi:hypothetical protein